MKESRNEEELRHAWVEWHNKSGGPIRESYQQFVELSNRAATMNSKLIDSAHTTSTNS